MLFTYKVLCRRAVFVLHVLVLWISVIETSRSHKFKTQNDDRPDCHNCSPVLRGERLECKNTCRAQYKTYVYKKCGVKRILDPVFNMCEPCDDCLLSDKDFREVSVISEEDCITFCDRPVSIKKPEPAAHGGSIRISVPIERPSDRDSDGSGSGMGDMEDDSSEAGSGYGQIPVQNTRKPYKSETNEDDGKEDLAFDGPDEVVASIQSVANANSAYNYKPIIHCTFCLVSVIKWHH